MKLGAFVPQGWRMDLTDVLPENQWETIVNSAKRIEKLNYDKEILRARVEQSIESAISETAKNENFICLSLDTYFLISTHG